MTRSLLLLTLLLGLTACASAPPVASIDNTNPVRDDLFPRYTLFTPETSSEIFALSAQAIAFARGSQSPHYSDRANIKSLVSHIFDHSELGLLYRNNANTVARETFDNRAANCLSLSIMTYAMAKAAGLSPQFYQVEIPEYWTRRDGYNLLNGHINMRISPAKNMTDLRFSEAFIDVDFDPQAIRNLFKREPVNRKQVEAMFYNNKGADALIANSYSKAYAYFRAAVRADPGLSQAWLNLGVLYRKNDAFDAAEASYKQALTLNNDNLTAWENLAILYQYTDREQESREILARVESKRQDNPFYHFILGEEAMDSGDAHIALKHYQRAYRLDRTQHEVLFGLGKAYYELGDISQAERFLTRASEQVNNAQDKYRYLSKLSALQSAR